MSFVKFQSALIPEKKGNLTTFSMKIHFKKGFKMCFYYW